MRRSATSDSLLKTALPTREATCPHCSRTFAAAVKAVQLRCPNCQRPLRFEDAHITRHVRENVATLGCVTVSRKASLTGTIECGSLSVSGSLIGTVRVRGTATIDSTGTVSGTLHADRCTIVPGGRLRGMLIVNTP